MVKNATPEVSVRFQDGRRRHFGISNAGYKMGNYHPILMNSGTQTKKTCSVWKSRKRMCRPNFNMAAAAILELEMRAIKRAFTSRFWRKLVHRLRKTCWVQNL
jgi:hypothetical protein